MTEGNIPITSRLLALPNELIYDIARWLPLPDVNSLGKVNRLVHALLRSLLRRLLASDSSRVLSWAAENMRESTFELALENGADTMSSLRPSCLSPILFAISFGWDRSVGRLLDRGVPIALPSGVRGSSLLHDAAMAGHVTTVRLLLDRGADITAMTASDNQPLHTALWAGKTEVAELLVSRGADVNSWVGNTSTLQMAVRPHTLILSSVKCLIAAGFDTTSRDQNNVRALDLAFCTVVEAGAGPTAEYLLCCGADINFRCPRNQEPVLHTAVRLHHWHLVEVLLRFCPDINALNRHDETALFGAISGPHRKKMFRTYWDDYLMDEEQHQTLPPGNFTGLLNAIKLLLDAGIDINHRTKLNRTAFFSAICDGCIPILRVLIDHGADINTHNGDDGSTPLHAVISCGDLKSLKFLLDAGCKINSPKDHGITPLHLAIQHWDIDTALLLLEEGCDINLRADILARFDPNPPNGKSPLYLAVRWGQDRLVRELLARGAEIDGLYNVKQSTKYKGNEEVCRRMKAVFAEQGLYPDIMSQASMEDEAVEWSDGDMVDDENLL